MHKFLTGFIFFTRTTRFKINPGHSGWRGHEAAATKDGTDVSFPHAELHSMWNLCFLRELTCGTRKRATLV